MRTMQLQEEEYTGVGSIQNEQTHVTCVQQRNTTQRQHAENEMIEGGGETQWRSVKQPTDLQNSEVVLGKTFVDRLYSVRVLLQVIACARQIACMSVRASFVQVRLRNSIVCTRNTTFQRRKQTDRARL